MMYDTFNFRYVYSLVFLLLALSVNPVQSLCNLECPFSVGFLENNHWQTDFSSSALEFLKYGFNINFNKLEKKQCLLFRKFMKNAEHINEDFEKIFIVNFLAGAFQAAVSALLRHCVRASLEVWHV